MKMTWYFENFFKLNTLFLGLCYVAYSTIVERNNERMYKNTIIFREAMDKLKSHPGAVHFLGEFIEDGKLKVMKEEKDDEKTTYHVKVLVRGTEGAGNMYFWLNRKDEASDAHLKRIELKLFDLNKRMLIYDSNKTGDTADVLA